MRRAALVGFVLALSACRPPVDKDGRPITVGRLRLRTFPVGAKVWIDGELKVEATPATLILPAGTYVLKMQLPPAEPLEVELHLSAGDVLERTYRLPTPPDATVTVLSDVEGAGVRINGWPRGYTPLRGVTTRAGPLDITVTAPDGRAKSVQGALAVAEQKIVEVTFGPPEPPPEVEAAEARDAAPPPSGSLAIVTIGALPNADVFDASGKKLGRTPILGVPMAAGAHRLSLRTRDGKYGRDVTIEVEAGRRQTFRFALPELPSR